MNTTQKLSRAIFLFALCSILIAPFSNLHAQTKRAMEIEDLFRIKRVSDPQISPDGKWIAYVVASVNKEANNSNSDIWLIPSSGGDARQLTFSPKADNNPRWSPDGKRIAFIRQPGAGGKPDSVLRQKHNPWSVAVGQVSDGSVQVIWKAPVTLRGSLPTTHGGTNLHWADGRIVFLSYADGWPHLYSIRPEGGIAELLTPGNFMAEHIRMSPDKKQMIFSANTGNDPLDIDRRHVVAVPVDKPGIKVLLPAVGTAVPEAGAAGKVFVLLRNNTYPSAALLPWL